MLMLKLSHQKFPTLSEMLSVTTINFFGRSLNASAHHSKWRADVVDTVVAVEAVFEVEVEGVVQVVKVVATMIGDTNKTS